jgi:hypothetical protein
MSFEHRAEWEWGWKTPLLLRFQAPNAVRSFLDTPLEKIDLPEAEACFSRRIADLKSSRIGMRFERVQEALFRNHPDTESLLTGLVIPGKTEIDLLHRLKSLPSVIIHWEVAVKFYLGLDECGSDDADRFVGPSLKDTLGRKSRTIFGRQLKVLEDPEVRRTYAEAFGITMQDRILTLPKVNGVLFHPFRGQTELHRPEVAAEGGQRGAWFEIDRLPDFLADLSSETGADTTRVRWLNDRRDWIREQTAVIPHPENETRLKDCLKSNLATRFQSHFTGGGDPIQGAVLRKSGNQENESRFFIVPSGWHRAASEVRIKT